MAWANPDLRLYHGTTELEDAPGRTRCGPGELSHGSCSELIELGDKRSIAMMSQKEKDNYWLVVRECLVAFHDVKRLDASQRVKFYRARIDSAEPQIASDIFYHNEPFDIACDIAGRDLPMNEELFAKYERILEGRQIQAHE
jgi:hypothetical protein